EMQRGALWTPGPNEKVGESAGVYEPGYPAQTDLVANLLFTTRQPGKAEVPIAVQDYPGGSIAVEDVAGSRATVVEFLRSAQRIVHAGCRVAGPGQQDDEPHPVLRRHAPEEMRFDPVLLRVGRRRQEAPPD